MLLINNKKFLAGIISLTLLLIIFLPFLTNAALVNCGNAPTVDSNGKITGGCDFKAFVTLINDIINWIQKLFEYFRI